MSDKGFVEWLKGRPVPDTLPGVESLAQRAWRQGAESQQQRISELEQQIADARESSDAYSERLAQQMEQAVMNETRLREQLAARDAELAEVKADEVFCDECLGPYEEGWLAEQYGGHWDTCPNRVRKGVEAMSDEAEKAWQVYSREQFFTDQYLKAAFMAGVESQQQRIRELEEQLAEKERLVRAFEYNRDQREQQLAARDAVIERVRKLPKTDLGMGNAGLDARSVCEVLDAAPESVLAEVKAEAWAEGVTAYGLRVAQELLKLLPQKIDMTNPYRKGAGQ